MKQTFAKQLIWEKKKSIRVTTTTFFLSVPFIIQIYADVQMKNIKLEINKKINKLHSDWEK